jgi:hypothetical protein
MEDNEEEYRRCKNCRFFSPIMYELWGMSQVSSKSFARRRTIPSNLRRLLVWGIWIKNFYPK